ncbi:MAG: leucyl aminopeptidase [Polyangiaceae bacterium]
MKITIRTAKPLEAQADVVAALVFAPYESKKAGLAAPIDAFDRQTRGALLAHLKDEDFKAKRDQSVSIATLGRLKSKRLVVVGLGDKAKLTATDVRQVFAKIAKAAVGEKAKSLAIVLPQGLLPMLREAAEGITLGAYRFTKYFTADKKPKVTLSNVTIYTTESVSAADKRSIDLGQKVAEGVNVARDLSNEPPNVIFPASLAQAAVEVGKASGLKVTVLDFKEVKKRGMGLLQAVGQGSANEPCLVHMEYHPAKPAGAAAKNAPAKKRIVFVGKGITFDTGGISIKPAAGMQEMKHDMSGAANVVGLMQAVAALRPDVEVHGILACAENMPGGNSYRPGDVWTSYEGKSVEIINTDAEGRLILADALTYAHRLKPDFLLDNATLTGACVVALGSTCSGWYASNDEAAGLFDAAVKGGGEQMWRMPLLEELKDQLKSDTADLKHMGDRFGGSITAALFLREFIGDTKNWIHCDIAGPAMADRSFRWDPKGGTGHGVLTFVKLVEQASAALSAPAAT